MPLQSYELTAELLESGNRYAVVTLADGSTFGQLVDPGDLAHVDRQIVAAVARYEAQREQAARPSLEPMTRTATEVQEAFQAQIDEPS